MGARLRGGAAAVAATLTIGAATGCGSDEPTAATSRIPPTAKVLITGPDGSGMAIWRPRTFADAVAGSDVVAVATVRSVREGAQIEGLPSPPSEELPPPLPALTVQIDVERIINRSGWARALPSAPTLYLLDPDEDAPLGVTAGRRYVFFLAEFDQVVEGNERAYHTAWSGAYVGIDGDRLEQLAEHEPGTTLAPTGSIDDLAATARQVSVDRRLATADVSASPNPMLTSRPRWRERSGYRPQDDRR